MTWLKEKFYFYDVVKCMWVQLGTPHLHQRGVPAANPYLIQ